MNDDLSTLVENYQAAYGAALESVQGQYALWDQAAEVTATSAGSINSALESQINYWEAYNSNLAGLTERSADIEGLSDMIASFADGSSDSVNAVAGMASATDEELAAMVANWQNLQDVQGTTADSLAQLETDFDNSLATIEERMNAAVDNMNMDTEAANAAKATIDAYIANIRAGSADAENAAAAVAAATARALAGNGSGVTGYDAIKAYGYRKTDEPGCTRDEVKERVLNGSKPTAEALENAEKVNAWLVSLEQVTEDRWIGDLERNGSMLALSGYAKSKHFGRLAYLPVAYEKYMERKTRDEQRAAARLAETASEHVGTVGQRITLTAMTAKLLTSWEGVYGTTYLYKFTDEQGNVYIWYASRGIETHDGMTLKATVKDHNERDGVKQTVLTRCKAA